MPEAALVPAGLQALVFDVDGTLYRQGPLRREMLARLAGAHLLRPVRLVRTLRVLQAYRRAHEALRGAAPSAALAGAQLDLASAGAGAPRAVVAEAVARWMEREPLPLLSRLVRPGLLELLRACRARGLRLAVLSDYPAEAKLEAMGLSGLFEVVVSAQDPAVGALKPSPRGILEVLRRLDVPPGAALYVGDRAEVDGGAARAAGVACAIVSRRPLPVAAGARARAVQGCAELAALLDASRPPAVPEERPRCSSS